tara:strand:+ start:73 stop:783 length:711 start_codon:yes stop_codon:yes gene_type:complete
MLSIVNELDLPIHMHVHETEQEINDSIEKYKMRPMARLQKIGLMNASMMAVHMTQLLDEEIETLAKSKVNVVHCPESNLKLASGFCPVQKLLNAGINVALGTDGAASNNDLDLFGEAKTAALIAKGITKDATSLPARKVLEMATINGAKALGQEDRIGSLESGKEADIIALNLGSFNTKPIYNLMSQLVYATGKDQVSDVWVSGARLLKRGKVCNIDTKKVMDKTTYWQERISKKI